jgi:hypothetical protein
MLKDAFGRQAELSSTWPRLPRSWAQRLPKLEHPICLETFLLSRDLVEEVVTVAEKLRGLIAKKRFLIIVEQLVQFRLG